MRSANSVALRQLAPADADVMAGWGDDPDFCRAADWSTGVTHAERATFLDNLIAQPPHGLTRLAAVAGGVIVGYVDLRGTAPDERELGFLIGSRASWRHGLGFAAASAACDYGFDTLGLRLIWAKTDAANVGSVTILKRLGMLQERTDDRHGLRFLLTQEAWRE